LIVDGLDRWSVATQWTKCGAAIEAFWQVPSFIRRQAGCGTVSKQARVTAALLAWEGRRCERRDILALGVMGCWRGTRHMRNGSGAPWMQTDEVDTMREVIRSDPHPRNWLRGDITLASREVRWRAIVPREAEKWMRQRRWPVRALIEDVTPLLLKWIRDYMWVPYAAALKAYMLRIGGKELLASCRKTRKADSALSVYNEELKQAREEGEEAAEWCNPAAVDRGDSARRMARRPPDSCANWVSVQSRTCGGLYCWTNPESQSPAYRCSKCAKAAKAKTAAQIDHTLRTPSSGVVVEHHERIFLLALGEGWAPGDVKRWLQKADVLASRIPVLQRQYTQTWGTFRYTSKHRASGRKRNCYDPRIEGYFTGRARPLPELQEDEAGSASDDGGVGVPVAPHSILECRKFPDSGAGRRGKMCLVEWTKEAHEDGWEPAGRTFRLFPALLGIHARETMEKEKVAITRRAADKAAARGQSSTVGASAQQNEAATRSTTTSRPRSGQSLASLWSRGRSEKQQVDRDRMQRVARVRLSHRRRALPNRPDTTPPRLRRQQRAPRAGSESSADDSDSDWWESPQRVTGKDGAVDKSGIG
jgi:hypothetical protein